jgi:hypothetical protein
LHKYILNPKMGFVNKIFFLILLQGLLTTGTFSQITIDPWQNIKESIIPTRGNRYIIPSEFRTVSLNIYTIQTILRSAPIENLQSPVKSNTILSIPYPDGTNREFYVTESPIMAPELAAQFSELKTYIVEAVDKSKAASGRIDFTPLGFHAMIFTGEGTIFIDPYAMGDDENYISYYAKNFTKLNPPINNQPCVVDNPEAREEIERILKNGNSVLSGNQLRTYRLALAADGEYTAFYGGTVSGAMNGIVTTMNRVDAVYEKDVAIRMILIANDSLIVYTNASTDPYTNTSGSKMLSQNQKTCDNVIGSANYDIGHVFSTGGGGIAYLGCVCGSFKAGGVTGGPSPIGDPFDIDYVAHEMGHQFGADHTFNSTSSSCGGGNRAASAAYEPGSATTIMGYAGICSPDDIQPHSDAYFHVKSIDEIIAYTISGSGNSCAVITSNGNIAPVVTVPAGGWTIPISTPFSLTGSATDGNGDNLTYCWEEFDLGPAGSPDSPSGNAPIFRSFTPYATPTRIFPQVSDLLNNVHTLGEILPTYTRSLAFRLTARDNRMGGGGVGYSGLSFNVTSTAGPFIVTSPNTNVTLNALSSQTITWNVANTTASPVSCSAVGIILSTDGGNTWPITLASNTPNDGTENVVLPDVITSRARVKVAAVGNIFFDISNVNFSISAPLVKQATFTALIQGFYNGSKMIQDTVTLELHNASTPYGLVESKKGVLDTTGTGQLYFTNAVNGTPYYLVIKHRNTVETWSAAPQTFSSGTLTYDFTSAQSKAYGNNQILKGSKYCLYSGDINQDGIVDSGDLGLTDNDNAGYVTGYIITDVNGDGIVDSGDLGIIDNNNANYVGKIVPTGAPASIYFSKQIQIIKTK